MQQNCQIIGIDNFNSYYDPKLKEERYKKLKQISRNNLEMYRGNIEDFGLFLKPLHMSYDSMNMEILISKQQRYVQT